MQRPLVLFLLKIGLPVLAGEFLIDWIKDSFLSAAEQFPERAVIVFAVSLMWVGFREHRERKKRTLR